MSIIIARDLLATFGTEQQLSDAVAGFTAAVAEHASTIGVPAPTAHPLVEHIVRQHGGEYSVEPEPEPEEPEPVPLTADDVWREKDRRLALGFDHDFADSRGVHRIGTTSADMVGWDEVSKFAQALINTGNGSTLITISTDTGITQLTAIEWQGVMLAAAAFRQPIWGASFVLANMDPIPADYATNEAYWP